MSNATRRIRSELATTITAALGSPQDYPHQPTEQERITTAEATLCERMKSLIAQLCDLGISKAKIARTLDVDPGALSDLFSDGCTTRLSLESLWQAYGTLSLFIDHAAETLLETRGHGKGGQAELLGFSAHPDEAKVTGSEALSTMGHNILAALGAGDGVMHPFGPYIKGASAVYSKDGYWVLTAIIRPDRPEEMTRIARDEIWHFEQWLRRNDTQSPKPKKLKSSF
jgi:hypothetical protein